MGDALREACGLFGVFGHPDAARKTYYGLFALQHRGQESCGIAVADGRRIRKHLDMGLVAEVFTTDAIERLSSERAIGHVRYSTTGGSLLCNAQPMVVNCSRGEIGVAHNGNLTNSVALRQELVRQGSIFQSSADSEVIVHLLARPSQLDFEEHLLAALGRLEGAFSLLFITPDAVIGARDPHGWRPLWLGRLENGAPAFASETCALELAQAEPVRELDPGEVVFATARGLASRRLAPAPRRAHCIFEHVYFARPDSTVFGDPVHDVRKRLGRELAREHPVEADVVVPIPDSGNHAALGFAEEARIPYDHGFVRSHYVGRTFLKPSQAERQEGVSMKLAVVRAAVAGKRVVVIDDSVVRGNTARSRVRLLRRAGASEVHLRVSCPPIRHPCFFGIDFPTGEELIANTHDHAGIERELEVDSLGYLSLEGMLRCVSKPRAEYCTACFSGEYPIRLPAGGADKLIHERGGC
ncbi:MAG TPA: amidophosphoribosyltransferase [Planctomycetota bacterium]|nr:amidophosphoribosyltransferase [Planctomycetota bacterium]